MDRGSARGTTRHGFLVYRRVVNEACCLCARAVVLLRHEDVFLFGLVRTMMRIYDVFRFGAGNLLAAQDAMQVGIQGLINKTGDSLECGAESLCRACSSSCSNDDAA